MLKIIPRFNLYTTAYDIIEIEKDSWKPIAGPYLSKDEAITDLRNIQNELMRPDRSCSNNDIF